MKSEPEIRAALVSGLTASLRRPPHVATDEQARIYLAELADTLIGMRPTDGEWDHIWPEFLRSWKKPHWPLPSEFPARLKAFRARQAAVLAAGRRVEAEAEAATGRRYDHALFMACCASASAQAASSDPREAMWGRLLHRMAVALIETRDDQDQPRARRLKIYRDRGAA